jgi:hypothetical protein
MGVAAGPPAVRVNAALANMGLARAVNVAAASAPPAGGNAVTQTNMAATLQAMSDAADQAAVNANILAQDTVMVARRWQTRPRRRTGP